MGWVSREGTTGGYRVLATTVVVEILCIALIASALAVGLPPAAAIAAGAVVAAFSLVKVKGRRPSEHLVVWTRHLLRRWGLTAMPPPGSAFDGASVGEPPPPSSGPRFAQGPRPGRALSVSSTTGFRWDGATLVCAARVRPRQRSATTLTFGRTLTADRLPMQTLAPLLSQFDIHLAGIDIVSIGSRVPTRGLVAQVYRRLVGPLPAISHRDTLILVRLDPASCPAAVARRGGGALGAVRTAKVAAARIIRGLDTAGYHCDLLTPAQLDETWTQHTGLTGTQTPTPSWGSVTADDGGRAAVHTSYAADILALTTPGIARVWDPAADHAIVSLRLRPSPRPDAANVGVLVRYVADQPVRVPDSLGLRPLDGQQLEGLYGAAPRGEPQFDRLCDFREVHAEETADLTITTTGCGQLIGGDSSGNAITASVFGPGVGRVEVVGEVYLARQVVLRAIALGARVLVRTDRRHAWIPLSREIADPALLHIADVAEFSGARARQFTVTVLDGPVHESPSQDGPGPQHTVISVLHHGDAPSPAVDLRIRQDTLDKERLLLEVGGNSFHVAMVTIPDETRLIGHPEGAALARP